MCIPLLPCVCPAVASPSFVFISHHLVLYSCRSMSTVTLLYQIKQQRSQLWSHWTGAVSIYSLLFVDGTPALPVFVRVIHPGRRGEVYKRKKRPEGMFLSLHHYTQGWEGNAKQECRDIGDNFVRDLFPILTNCDNFFLLILFTKKWWCIFFETSVLRMIWNFEEIRDYKHSSVCQQQHLLFLFQSTMVCWCFDGWKC